MQKILAIQPHDIKPAASGIVERLNSLFPESLVMSVGSREEALSAAQKEQPDIILLGDIIEEAEGNEFCRQLKSSETTRHIPVIMFTEKESEPYLQSPAECEYGADILLAKSISDQELEVHLKLLPRLKKAEDQLRFQDSLLEEAMKTTRAMQKELEKQKRVHEELRQSEEKLRQLVHHSNDAIYLLHNRKFEFINRKFEEMFKVTLEEVNRPDFDFIQLVAPRSRTLIEERGRRQQQGEDIESRYEFTALSGSGREIEVEASVSRIKYKGGYAILGVVRDINQRKQLERQIRHAQKIEAIGTLAGGISHQFNNILAIIRGYTELTLDSLPENSLLKRNLQHVITASDRAGNLVNQILIFSQQAREGQKPLEISLILNESLPLLQSSMPTNIVLRKNISSNLGFIMAEPNQIRQLIVNLCTNATHAIGNESGVIEITLKKVDLGPVDLVNLKNMEPGPYLELSVSDSGHGMEQDVKERIFDPFFTTKSAGEGIGMGLAVIHGIVKTCGGDILVETDPGSGTTFHLFFPCIDKEKTEEPKEKEFANVDPREKIPMGNERLLFVDDERMLLEVQQQILERMGYHVVAVPNGLEALDIFSADPEIFDLVITDHAMPGMTGIELARKMLKIRPDLPIILCTGLTNASVCEEAMRAGIKEFIMKPIVMKNLAGMIRDVLKNNSPKNV